MQTDETSGSPSGPTQVERLALAALMFFTSGIFGFLQPFVPLYLEASGLTKSQFGLVTALGTGAALLIQPPLGRLSDRLDRRKPFMVAAAIWAGLAYLTYRFADGFWGFVLLTAAGVNGYQYINVAGGVLAGRLAQMTGQGGGMSYVRYRVWGSVGYIVIAMTTGLLVNRSLPVPNAPSRADLDAVFTYAPLLFFVIAVISLLVPDYPAVKPKTVAPTKEEKDSPATEDTHDARKQANLTAFLVAYSLYNFGLYGASGFLPFYMRQLGATPLMITGMFAAGVICEVLVMTQVGRWTDRYGRRPALALSMLLMPLRLLLYIPATTPAWVMVIQMLHGINFGIVGTIAVVFINDLAPPHERGSYQARQAVASGIAMAIAPIVCGWLSDNFGLRVMFAAMSVVGMASAAVFLTFVRESNHKRETHPNPLIRLLAGKL